MEPGNDRMLCYIYAPVPDMNKDLLNTVISLLDDVI